MPAHYSGTPFKEEGNIASPAAQPADSAKANCQALGSVFSRHMLPVTNPDGALCLRLMMTHAKVPGILAVLFTTSILFYNSERHADSMLFALMNLPWAWGGQTILDLMYAFCGKQLSRYCRSAADQWYLCVGAFNGSHIAASLVSYIFPGFILVWIYAYTGIGSLGRLRSSCVFVSFSHRRARESLRFCWSHCWQ